MPRFNAREGEEKTMITAQEMSKDCFCWKIDREIEDLIAAGVDGYEIARVLRKRADRVSKR
jgi:hypothetical protein